MKASKPLTGYRRDTAWRARPWRPRLAAFALFVSLLALVAWTKPAEAAQTLIVDETYQHQVNEASHHGSKPVATMPTDLAAPVDYRKGSVHLRVDLKTTASAKGVRWLMTLAQGAAYVCVGPQKAMPGPGVYEWDVPIASFQCPNAAYNYAKPPQTVSFVIRDSNGVKVDPGAAYDGAPNLALYFPLSARVTVHLVSNGSKFEPESTQPDDEATDGTPSDPGPPVEADLSDGRPIDPVAADPNDSPRPQGSTTGRAPGLGIDQNVSCAMRSRTSASPAILALSSMLFAMIVFRRRRFGAT